MEQRPRRVTTRRLVRMMARTIGLVALVAAGYLALTPTGRYLVRAAWEEAKILARRRSIVELVDDAATPDQVRQKLRLVLETRAFAEAVLDLRAKDSFTTFSQLDRDTLVLVLSAAYRDRLLRRTWWFPIVGRVPYKGYFDFGDARASAQQLERLDFDTYLRPAAAFSTLGFFNDPLLSTTLHQDSVDLANTVIHEITHSTFFAPGEAVFNESFATFVGARGAAAFFRARGHAAAAQLVDARWADQKHLARFWGHLHRALDSTFNAHPGDAQKRRRLALRDSIYRAARSRLIDSVAPLMQTISRRALERARFDNAALLARRVYQTELDLFDAIYAREGGDLRTTVHRVIAIARTAPDEPFSGLRRVLGDPAGDVAAGGYAPGRDSPPKRPRIIPRRSIPADSGGG